MLSPKIENKLIHLFLLLLFYMVMEVLASVIKFIIRKKELKLLLFAYNMEKKIFLRINVSLERLCKKSHFYISNEQLKTEI